MTRNFAQRLSSTGSYETDDLTLDWWDQTVPDEAWSFRDVPPRESDDAFDVEVAKPRAVGLARLYRVLGKAVPAHIQASLGDNAAVLLSHGVTPFYKAGRKPAGVWGMGYRSEVDDARCATVALFPPSRRYDVIEVSQRLSFGIKLGGEMGFPDGLQISEAPFDVQLTGSRLHATTDQEFAIAVQCTFSVLEVQAGPVGAGGARWNLYRGRESIEAYQPLFQTMLVPKGIASLRFTIETWIRRSGRFFGLLKARHWTYPRQTFEVVLEGLDE